MTAAPDGPFTDQALVRGPLYVSADRLARCTSASHRARVADWHAGEVIADLAEVALAEAGAAEVDVLMQASRFD